MCGRVGRVAGLADSQSRRRSGSLKETDNRTIGQSGAIGGQSGQVGFGLGWVGLGW